MRRTKIICTIGPACWTAPQLGALAEAGMDVARLNFAHGTHEEHARIIADLRAISKERGRPLAILQDLAGPKLRIGAVAKEPVMLQAGAMLTLTPETVPGTAERLTINDAGLAAEIKPGQTILLADGAITLAVRAVSGRELRCEVVNGGPLSSHAGMHAPGARLSLPALTKKDEEDLRFGLERGIDWIALSFVRQAQDLEPVRAICAEHGMTVPVIAKIEKPEALDDLPAIIESADGVMVARGDLGVELPLERVPRIQKQLIAASNRAGKPVITATQMLQSMVTQPRPTRAEVADVAAAILDGTDAVLLASETATGRYPTGATAQLARIIGETERGMDYEERFWRRRSIPKRDLPHAISHAACMMASDLGVTAIVTPTWSGGTARRVSSYRPGAPIIAVSPNIATVRRLMLCWGVYPTLVEEYTTTDEMIACAKAAASASGLVPRGAMVIITAGVPVGSAGATNLIKAEQL
ncbi:MAG: pyruvate kinase [Nitrospirota bacterium]